MKTPLLAAFLLLTACGPRDLTETVIVLSSTKETMQIPTREPDWMEK